MKKIIHYSALFILTACISFTGCKKEDPGSPFINIPPPPPPPPSSPHIIKTRIIEFGTGIPLTDVTVNAWANRAILIHTDMNGECSFEANQVAFRKFTKPGYWEPVFNINFGSPGSGYLFSPVTLFPASTSFYNSPESGLSL